MRETIKAAHAFDLYWQMGDQRSLDKVAQALSKSLPLIKEWSSAHGWQERVRQKQAEEAAKADESRRERIDAFERRLADEGAQLYGEALDFVRAQLSQRRLSVPAVMLLERARSDALRGLRQPESVTRTEQTGPNGGPIHTKEERAPFDYDAYRRSFPELEAAILGGPPTPDG